MKYDRNFPTATYDFDQDSIIVVIIITCIWKILENFVVTVRKETFSSPLFAIMLLFVW